MKIANPAMRYRLESNGVNKQAVTLSERTESGLEAPETFWVELSEYDGDPVDPSEYVWEVVNGVPTAGVPLQWVSHPILSC